MTGRRVQIVQHSWIRFAWVVFPILALALALVGWFGRAATPDRRPSPVPVGEAAYVCPLLGGVRVTTGQVAAGSAAQTTVYPGGVASAGDPRRWRSMAAQGDAVAVEQRGLKSGAVGFVRGQMSGPLGGGLVVGACPGIGDESWFVGLGSSPAHQSTLVLTNIGSSPAIADINLWAVDGPVPAIGNRGLVVKPHSVRVVPIRTLAGGEVELGLQVIRRRGALSATALDTSREGRKGSESVVGVLPARKLRLTAIPAGSDSRTLMLLNAGDRSTRASVKIFGSRAPFTPEGLSNVSLPAGKLVYVAVPPQRFPVSLEVSAGRQIVGAVRVASGHADFGYAMSAQPIEHAAVAPLVPGVFPVIVVTSTGTPAKVTVTGLDASMKRIAQVTGDVPADSTRALDLKVLRRVQPTYLEIRSTDPVVGAALYLSGRLLAILPLADAPLYRPGPDVMPAD